MSFFHYFLYRCWCCWCWCYCWCFRVYRRIILFVCLFFFISLTFYVMPTILVCHFHVFFSFYGYLWCFEPWKICQFIKICASRKISFRYRNKKCVKLLKRSHSTGCLAAAAAAIFLQFPFLSIIWFVGISVYIHATCLTSRSVCRCQYNRLNILFCWSILIKLCTLSLLVVALFWCCCRCCCCCFLSTGFHFISFVRWHSTRPVFYCTTFCLVYFCQFSQPKPW